MVSSTRFPPTPFSTTPFTNSITSLPPTPSISTTLPQSTIDPPLSSTSGPPFSMTSVPSGAQGLSTPTMPAVMMKMSTVAQGMFGVGANFDPLIIAGLVLAGLIVLLLLGALIYCCCRYCCVPMGHEHVIKRTPSFHTIRQERPPTRPIYLTASLSPAEYSSSAEDPAASVLFEHPLRVSVGAYAAAGSSARNVAGSYPTERPVVIGTVTRKKYLYPADVVGVGNDVTYNTIRPTIMTGSGPVITTLGDGYAMGHSLRATGNRFGGRRFLVYDEDPSPQIITIY